MVELKDGERIDDLHRNGYKIIQAKDGFCFGIDAVLLSHFAQAKDGDSVLDIGTGTGIIPILMSAKKDAKKYTAIDIQDESIDMTKRSVYLNGLDDIIESIKLDIKDAKNKFERASFDVITSNPPYMNMGGGILNEYSKKMIARHEICCTLEDIIQNVSYLLKPNKSFYMVHRPSRLADIIFLLRKYGLEPKTMQLVQPYVDKEPNIVLIHSIKGGKPFLKTLETLIVYNSDGTYTKEIDNIYNN